MRTHRTRKCVCSAYRSVIPRSRLCVHCVAQCWYTQHVMYHATRIARGSSWTAPDRLRSRPPSLGRGFSGWRLEGGGSGDRGPSAPPMRVGLQTTRWGGGAVGREVPSTRTAHLRIVEIHSSHVSSSSRSWHRDPQHGNRMTLALAPQPSEQVAPIRSSIVLFGEPSANLMQPSGPQCGAQQSPSSPADGLKLAAADPGAMIRPGCLIPADALGRHVPTLLICSLSVGGPVSLRACGVERLSEGHHPGQECDFYVGLVRCE